MIRVDRLIGNAKESAGIKRVKVLSARYGVNKSLIPRDESSVSGLCLFKVGLCEIKALSCSNRGFDGAITRDILNLEPAPEGRFFAAISSGFSPVRIESIEYVSSILLCSSFSIFLSVLVNPEICSSLLDEPTLLEDLPENEVIEGVEEGDFLEVDFIGFLVFLAGQKCEYIPNLDIAVRIEAWQAENSL